MKRIRLDLNSTVYVILFILLCRNIIIIYPLYRIDIIDQLYTYLSAIVSLIFSAYILLIKKDVIDTKILILIFADAAFSVLSTLINGGDLKTYFISFYPTIALICFWTKLTDDGFQFKKFLNSVSKFFVLITGLNLALMGIEGRFFSGFWYFLGLENQMSFTLLLGVYFNYLNKIYNKKNILFYCYAVIYILTSFAVHSGSGVFSVLLFIVVEIIPFFKKVIQKINMSTIIVIIIGVLIFLGVYSLYMVDIKIIRWFTEEILGKDVTFTGRTYIWEMLLNQVAQKPFLGYGYHANSNFFILNGHPLSAHNTFFAKLYCGGSISILFTFLILFSSVKYIQKAEQDIAMVHKLLFLLIVIPMMAEAFSNNILYIIIFGGIAISRKEKI